MKKIVTRSRLKNIAMNTVGSVLLAFAVCAFIEPFGLIIGGATGVAMVIHHLFHVPMSTVLLVLNICVLPMCALAGGKKLFLGSVFSSLIYPVAVGVFERIPQITTIADTTWLAALCGGIVSGVGIGLVMKSGGSTGGFDIPVLVLHKFLKKPVGTVMNVMDSCIMICQIPIFGLNSIIYGLIYTFLMTNAINYILTMGEDCIRVTIISEKYEELRRELLKNDFGLAMIYAEGGLTQTKLLKIESVMRSVSYRKVSEIIDQIDPEAFVTIEKVKNVRGRGYTIERVVLEFE
ncbi:MAG: YitT family protein [Eubacteriales bacterium]|nr:YitT family protein [Eubacteriales bacterium]